MSATSTGVRIAAPSLPNTSRKPIPHNPAKSFNLAFNRASFNGASSALLYPFPVSQHRLSMRAATKGAYICRDCGYIYSDRKPFEKLPDSFQCPVCSAPKRQFKPYDLPVASNANQFEVRKARKSQLKSSDGSALPIGIAIGVAALVGVFLYLNSQY